MDQKDQKTTDTAVEPQVEASVEIEDNDLEVVTGGLVSGITSGPTDPCITSLG